MCYFLSHLMLKVCKASMLFFHGKFWNKGWELVVASDAYLYLVVLGLSVDNLHDVQAEIYDVRADWKKLGLALKIPAGTLDTIKADSTEASLRFLKMLQVWLQTSGDKKTWQVLAEALGGDVVGRPDLKKKILDKHQH